MNNGEVSKEEGQEYAKNINVRFYEVSAKEKKQIKEMFEATAKEHHFKFFGN